MAGGLSYAEVRDLVSDQMGTCEISPEEMEANLLGILEDVKNRIGNAISKNTKDTLTVEVGVYAYAVPATIERVTSISNNDGHELSRSAYPCATCVDNAETGSPTTWHMDVDQVVLHPIPVADEVFVVRGTKARDHVLFDVGTDNLRIWRMVDLPVGLHYAYAEAVLAQSLMREDPGSATLFAQSAWDKIANWKRDQTSSQGNAQRPMKMSSQRSGGYTWGQSGRRNWNQNPVVP